MADMAGFFESLERCSNAERAVLRKNCGKKIGEADGQAMVIFYRCLPYDVPRWQEDRWFAAACFSCLWKPEARKQPIESVLAQLKQLSGSMEHRLAGLLDLPWDQDCFLLGKLAGTLKLAKSKGLAADCEKLLEDLLCWNSGSQSVQRKWAKAMYIEEYTKKQED